MANTGSFNDLFSFRRRRAAPFRDGAGSVVTAALDQPRLDHDVSGAKLGLLVEGPAGRRGDQLQAIGGDWASAEGGGTCLHVYRTPEGSTVRQAFYANDGLAAVNACLALAGHHQVIGFIPARLPDRGGFVRYLGVEYDLPGRLLVQAGVGLDVGDGSSLVVG